MDKKLIKHLIIAIFIVALVVIFVPMFFGERFDKEAETTAIPTAPEEPFLEQKLEPDMAEIEQKPEVLEETIDDLKAQEPKPSDKIEKDDDTIIQSALAPIDVSVDKIEPETSDKPIVTKAPVPKPKTALIPAKKKPTINKKIAIKRIEKVKQYEKSWVVQLGSFVQIQRANLLIKKLRDKGFHAFGYRKFLKPNQAINRVYVGPFSNIESAKQTRKKLNDTMNIKGIIIKYDPTDID